MSKLECPSTSAKFDEVLGIARGYRTSRHGRRAPDGGLPKSGVCDSQYHLPTQAGAMLMICVNAGAVSAIIVLSGCRILLSGPLGVRMAAERRRQMKAFLLFTAKDLDE
ncbi:MAG: hypothetical protein ACYTF6_13265 [Planctomycetota bacterium]